MVYVGFLKDELILIHDVQWATKLSRGQVSDTLILANKTYPVFDWKVVYLDSDIAILQGD